MHNDADKESVQMSSIPSMLDICTDSSVERIACWGIPQPIVIIMLGLCNPTTCCDGPARCGALRHVGRLAHCRGYLLRCVGHRVARLAPCRGALVVSGVGCARCGVVALRCVALRVAASIALRRCRDLKMTLDNYARMPALVASMLATTTTKTNKQHIIPKAHHEKPKAHLG